MLPAFVRTLKAPGSNFQNCIRRNHELVPDLADDNTCYACVCQKLIVDCDEHKIKLAQFYDSLALIYRYHRITHTMILKG